MLMNLQQTLLCSCPQTNRRTLCPAASWNGFMIVLAFISRTSASNRRSTRWRPRSRWVLRGEEQFHENTRRNTRLKATKAAMYCLFSCVRAAFILNEIKHLVSDSQVDWKHETAQWVQHLIQEIYQTRKMHLDQKDRVVHILMATWCTALFNHLYKTCRRHRAEVSQSVIGLCFQNEGSNLWPTSRGTSLPYPAGTQSTRRPSPSLWVHRDGQQVTEVLNERTCRYLFVDIRLLIHFLCNINIY